MTLMTSLSSSARDWRCTLSHTTERCLTSFSSNNDTQPLDYKLCNTSFHLHAIMKSVSAVAIVTRIHFSLVPDLS